MNEVKENPVHELIKKQLDLIYDTAIEITGAFNHKYIHMDTLWELLHSNRAKDDVEFPIVKKEVWHKMLDNLYIVSKRYCNEYTEKDRLPMIILRGYLDQLKDNLA